MCVCVCTCVCVCVCVCAHVHVRFERVCVRMHLCVWECMHVQARHDPSCPLPLKLIPAHPLSCRRSLACSSSPPPLSCQMARPSSQACRQALRPPRRAWQTGAQVFRSWCL